MLAVVLCLGLLSACGSSDDSSETEAETEAETETETETEAETEDDSAAAAATEGYVLDSISVSCSSDGGTFDPYTRGGWGKMAVGDLLFQYLGDVDNEGNPHWTIAKDVEMSDDEMDYTITIWDCVYDSIGNHITADDIVFSFDYFRSVGLGSATNCESFTALDDYTLEWVCSQKPAKGEIVDSLCNFSIVSQETYENYCGGSMNNNPIGTGPYVLEDYTVGSNFTFVANEDFWMLSLPEDVLADSWLYVKQNVREIHYDIIQDSASIAMALENGDIDAADSLGESDIKSFKGMPEDYNMIEMTAVPPLGLIFNCSDDSPCGDINLRYAICYGIDVVTIAEQSEILPAVQAFGIITRTYDAPEVFSTGEGRDYYDYDPELAKEYLAQSSYNGEELTMSYTSSTFNDYVATMIQAELNDIGITISQNQWEKVVEDVDKYDSTAWDLRLLTLGGGNYSWGVMRQFTSYNVASYLPEGMNMFFEVNPTLDELYDVVYNDGGEEDMIAWDEEISYNRMNIYSLCNYSNMTACRSGIMLEVGKKFETILPNTVYLTD